MPLPSITHHNAVRCRAKTKQAGLTCKNPAAYGMPVCRVHGARKKHTIRHGQQHPNYRHGERSREVINASRAARKRIKWLLDLAMENGLIKKRR